MSEEEISEEESQEWEEENEDERGEEEVGKTLGKADYDRIGGGRAQPEHSHFIISNIRTFGAELDMKEGYIDDCVGIVEKWPYFDNYNPKVMLLAALYQLTQPPTLTSRTYAAFLDSLHKFASHSSGISRIVRREGKTGILHADLIRYIMFFVVGGGKRGYEKTIASVTFE